MIFHKCSSTGGSCVAATRIKPGSRAMTFAHRSFKFSFFNFSAFFCLETLDARKSHSFRTSSEHNKQPVLNGSVRFSSQCFAYDPVEKSPQPPVFVIFVTFDLPCPGHCIFIKASNVGIVAIKFLISLLHSLHAYSLRHFDFSSLAHDLHLYGKGPCNILKIQKHFTNNMGVLNVTLSTIRLTTHAVLTITSQTVHFTTPPLAGAAALIFSNSTLDFNVQAGIIAGGFITSSLLILLFVMLLFNFCTCSSVDVKDTCLLVFFKWLLYKYCPCCFKNYRKKLNKEQERLRRNEEAEEMEDFVQVGK